MEQVAACLDKHCLMFQLLTAGLTVVGGLLLSTAVAVACVKVCYHIQDAEHIPRGAAL